MHSGDVIAERFEIEHLAGRGGMGTVFRARDRETGGPVAIKVQSGCGEAQGRRWAREAMLLGDLSGPGTVRYLSHGRTPTGDLYLVMEWLEGEDLAARLELERLTVSESLGLVGQVATALAPVHLRGIIHRDIKPSNLFLVERDVSRVKVIDFGIARIVGGGASSHALLGTPGYVAPEQARGASSIDARADVFALGCVLFECLTGRPAFVGEHVMALLAKILFDEAPRPSDVDPSFPDELDDLVARMLAKNPEERPANGGVVAAQIQALTLRGDSLARRAPRAPVLTRREQRLLFIVLVGSNRNGAASKTVEAQRTLSESTEVAQEIHAVARAYNGVATALADRTTLIAIESSGTANDQAMHAARCARALRAIAPEIPLAIALGRTNGGERLPVGAALDRCRHLMGVAHEVRTPVAPLPILLDSGIEGLLDSRFDLAHLGAIATLENEKLRLELPRTFVGKPTLCLGRDRELAELEALLAESTQQRVSRAVLVTGPAGIGKSRLLDELLARVQHWPRAPQIWLGRGDPMRVGAPFGLLAQAIRHAAGTHEREPADLRRARIRARVAKCVPSHDQQRVGEFLCELAGAPIQADPSLQLRAARADAGLMRDQLASAWTDWLSAETSIEPTLLVLEDVHWGDLPSLRFVDAGLRRVRDQGWIVLALARPDVHETFPRLWADRRVREIRLEELSRGSAERLVVEALGERATPATVKRLVDRAEGIPLYLEELIRGEVRGNGTVDPPDTLLAMLQARLERLEVETRRVLRAASVFGETFHPQAVTLLCGADTDVSAALRELEEHELIERRRSVRSRDDEEFVFRHGLVREAAYATLTESDRALGHRLAAQWLEEHGESDAMTLAEHCERGQDGAGAARWFVSASEQALRANDLDAVIARADRGVACGAEGETLGALRLLQSEAQLWRGELGSAERYVILAMEHLPHGSTRWYRAALGLLMQSASSESKSAHVIAELAAAARSERSAAQTMAFALALRLRTMENDLEGAKPFFAHLQTIDRENHDRPELTAMVPAGLFYWWSYVDFDPWLRKQCSERCASESESVGDAMNSAMASVHIGWANIALGAYEEAERVLTETLERASERGFGHLIGGFARLYLGAALGRLGRLEEARTLEIETAAKLFEAGNWLYGGLARAELARILFEMGQCDAARHEARSACEVLARVPAVQIGALAIHSRLALATAEPELALELAQAGARILDAHGCVTESEVCLRLSLSDALAATNQPHASELELERASRLLDSRAERILDANWRRSFVGRVSENVEVAERFAGSSRIRIS